MRECFLWNFPYLNLVLERIQGVLDGVRKSSWIIVQLNDVRIWRLNDPAVHGFPPPASHPRVARATERRCHQLLIFDVPAASGFASHCPGRKPPLLAVKGPACPYKSPIQTRFTMGNAEGA